MKKKSDSILSMRTLFLIESPNKVQTIEGILKDLNYTDVVVCSTKGHFSHIADTGKYNMGIDPETFECKWELDKEKKDEVKELKEQVKLADKIIIATDPDREGEAIAWSFKKFLNIKDKDYERITYNEVTKTAIQKALENPRKIDENLVEAAHTRSKLDKIVGYRLSPIAKKTLQAKSVGRCQSAALKLIVDREKEIQSFTTEKYYELFLNFNKRGSNYQFRAKYIYKNEEKKEESKLRGIESVNQIKKDCEGKPYIVDSIITKPSYQAPQNPFTTDTYLAAAEKIGLNTDVATSCAQKLFEGIDIGGKHVALITYIRTDNDVISSEFIDSLKEYVVENYGEQYYSGPRPSKEKNNPNVQAGHEAIRCIDLNMTPQKLNRYITDTRLLKAYELIYKRTVASVMSDRNFDATTYTIVNGKHKFTMQNKKETFDGWRKLYTYKDTDEEEEEIIEETLSKNDTLINCVLEEVEKETQPPHRYSRGSLVTKLKKLGIGRPSTYRPTIATLIDETRNYCVTDKNDILTPTSLGIQLVEFLDKNFADIINSGYTATLEKSLDEIEAGTLDSTTFLKEFYIQLNDEINKCDTSSFNRVCPECGGKLVVRNGKYGQFLGCSNYPNCKHIEKI